MKKLLLILFILISNVCYSQHIKTTYTELNFGASFGNIPVFPGASALYGAHHQYESGFVLDYEGGLALPSLITAKGGVGFAINEKFDLTLGVRAWPTSTYIQLKSNRPSRPRDIVFTIEAMPWSATSLGQSTIFTVGWRHKIIR